MHLRQCEDCNDRVTAHANLWTLLGDWDASPVSASFNRELYARIQKECSSGWWGSLSRVLNGWVARPAMPLAALSFLVFVGFYLERPEAITPAVPAVAEVPVTVTPNDADQLDKALDDLQLLHQLDVVKDEAAQASHGM